jgi:hypothetical protein
VLASGFTIDLFSRCKIVMEGNVPCYWKL